MKAKLLLVMAMSLLLLNGISPSIPRVRGDFAVSNSNRSDFVWSGQNLGSSVSISNVSTTGAAYQGGMVVYGANQPNMYSGVMASIGCNNPAFIRNMKVTVSITDPLGNTLSPGRIGNIGMLSSPSSQANDWEHELLTMYNLLVSILGSAVPLPSLQNGTPATGTGSDASNVWAGWNAVDYSTSECSHGLTLRFQPDFVNPGVYTVAVQTHSEVWAVMNTQLNFLASADSSYSFQYVYENDANSGNDAGSTFSTALGTPLGSYTGLLYGADTVDMYKFDVSAGQSVYYNVIPPLSASFPVSFYYPNWTYATGSNLGTGAVNYGSFTATATTTGSWFMKVYIVNGSGPYSFTLSNTPLPQDFTIDANPTSLCMAAGFSSGSVITLRSLQGYSGSVSVSSSLSPSTTYVSTYVTASPLTLASSSYAQTNVQVQASSSDFSQGSYTTHVTANSGSLSHSLDVRVTVSNDPTVCPPTSGHGAGGSVAAGTLITLADGSTDPVQLVQVGSVVRTYDVFSQTRGIAVVTNIRTVVVDNQLEIYTASGLPFRTDANPMFRLHVMRNGLVALMPVTEIQPGDMLFSYNDMTWVPVERVRVSFGGQHTVYDLTTSPIADFIANGYADCVKACRF